ADLTDLSGLGALVTPTLTLEPRAGNPPPRTAESLGGLLHSTGLPNPGLNAFLAEYLPRLRDLPCPLIVSMRADTPEEWARLAEALSRAGGVAALEANLTPSPLLFAERAAERVPSEGALATMIHAAVRKVRETTDLPLIAKLPAAGIDVQTAIEACEGQIVAVGVGQAFPAVAVHQGRGRFRFPGVVGALSGPAIKPLALYQVWRAVQATNLPVIGGGGVLSLEDALDFFLTGATAVAVGLAGLIHPDAIPRLTGALRHYLNDRQIPDLSALRGTAAGTPATS
ncbi:MAG: hypothetical protein NZ557_08835, partial [Chthonomonadaceae bacterium]|nr:hypothetical protein [Chthonomonadaceae bacterium]